MTTLQKLRKELLSRASEFARRGEAWSSRETRMVSDKAKRIRELVEKSFPDDIDNMLKLFSIVIGENIPPSSGSREFEPGLFLVDDDATYFTVGGLEDDDGETWSASTLMDVSGDTYTASEGVRPAGIDEIAEFISGAPKGTLLDMDEVLNGEKGEEE